jgi:hypothetical protein
MFCSFPHGERLGWGLDKKSNPVETLLESKEKKQILKSTLLDLGVNYTI